VTALETQLLLARLMLLALLYTFVAGVGMIAWLDLRVARGGKVQLRTTPGGCRLIVLHGAASDRPAGTAFPLGAATSIGRDLDNEIVLADPTVSARHAVVSRRSGAWWLEDLASTNGTFVNGRQIAPETPELLRSGDVVQIGEVRMRIAAADE
jgi:hypothetical protein